MSRLAWSAAFILILFAVIEAKAQGTLQATRDSVHPPSSPRTDAAAAPAPAPAGNNGGTNNSGGGNPDDEVPLEAIAGGAILGTIAAGYVILAPFYGPFN